MDDYLSRLRQAIAAEVPPRLALFDTMAGEARFARAWLDDDLARLPRDAQLLEVGGGVFILACLLAREGRALTVIEPVGSGFGDFAELAAAVLAVSARDGLLPRIVRCRAEDYQADGPVSFAFSLNVMEHVADPGQVLRRIAAALVPGGSYRFLCPNYLFPYEPHFNMPTLGTKRLTERVMRRHIEENGAMEDPAGAWRSLNWITVPRVRRLAAADPAVRVQFETRTLSWMLRRALHEPGFAARRKAWIVALVRALDRSRLLDLAGFIPATLQPVMDVRLTRTA